jgi:hypothetical protein
VWILFNKVSLIKYHTQKEMRIRNTLLGRSIEIVITGPKVQFLALDRLARILTISKSLIQLLSIRERCERATILSQVIQFLIQFQHSLIIIHLQSLRFLRRPLRAVAL